MAQPRRARRRAVGHLELVADRRDVVRALWNGYYLAHPDRAIYTAAVDDAIHIVTGIGGKGMTTGPAFARHSIDAILGL